MAGVLKLFSSLAGQTSLISLRACWDDAACSKHNRQLKAQDVEPPCIWQKFGTQKFQKADDDEGVGLHYRDFSCRVNN